MALRATAPTFVCGQRAAKQEIGPVLPKGQGLFGHLRYLRVAPGRCYYGDCQDCYQQYCCDLHLAQPRAYPLAAYRIGRVPEPPPDILTEIRRLLHRSQPLPELMRWRRVNRAWRDWLDKTPGLWSRVLEQRTAGAHRQLARVRIWGRYFELWRQIRELLPGYSAAPVYAYFTRSDRPSFRSLYRIRIQLQRVREQARSLLANDFLREKQARLLARQQRERPKYYRRFFSCCGMSDSDSEYETDDGSQPDSGPRYLRTEGGTYQPAPPSPPPETDSDTYSDTLSEDD